MILFEIGLDPLIAAYIKIRLPTFQLVPLQLATSHGYHCYFHAGWGPDFSPSRFDI